VQPQMPAALGRLKEAVSAIMAPNQGEAPMAGLPPNAPSKPNEGCLAYPSAAQDTENVSERAQSSPPVYRMQGLHDPAMNEPSCRATNPSTKVMRWANNPAGHHSAQRGCHSNNSAPGRTPCSSAERTKLLGHIHPRKRITSSATEPRIFKIARFCKRLIHRISNRIWYKITNMIT